MSMKVAFTGTQDLSLQGEERIKDFVSKLPYDCVVITGACIGVDAYVAQVAKGFGYKVHTVVPSNRSKVDESWRDWCDTFEELPPGAKEPYRERNQRMVDLADAVVGFPAYPEDHGKSRRSGTWMTIRMARKSKKPLYVFQLPDGGSRDLHKDT